MLKYIFSFHFLERYGFQALLYLTILGCIVYLPFRRHWDKVFGWLDAVIFDCCLAIPLVLYACFFVYADTAPSVGNIIITVIAAIVDMMRKSWKWVPLTLLPMLVAVLTVAVLLPRRHL